MQDHLDAVTAVFDDLGFEDYNWRHFNDLMDRSHDAEISAEAHRILDKVISDAMETVTLRLKDTWTSIEPIFAIEEEISKCAVCGRRLYGKDCTVGMNATYCVPCFKKPQIIDTARISNETIKLSLDSLIKLCGSLNFEGGFATDFVCTLIFNKFRKAKVTYEEEWPFTLAQECHIFCSRTRMGLALDHYREQYNNIRRAMSHLSGKVGMVDSDGEYEPPSPANSMGDSEKSAETDNEVNEDMEME